MAINIIRSPELNSKDWRTIRFARDIITIIPIVPATIPRVWIVVSLSRKIIQAIAAVVNGCPALTSDTLMAVV